RNRTYAISRRAPFNGVLLSSNSADFTFAPSSAVTAYRPPGPSGPALKVPVFTTHASCSAPKPTVRADSAEEIAAFLPFGWPGRVEAEETTITTARKRRER